MLSYTHFITYLKSPQLYKKIYIDGVKIETPQMTVGKKLHEFHNYFWQNVKIDGTSISIDIPQEFSDIEEYIEKIIYLEKRRIEFLVKKNKKENIHPLFIEKEFSNNHLGICGIIDRIEKDGEDKIGIIELKLKHIRPEYYIQLYFYKILLNPSIPIEWGAVFTGNKKVKYITFDKNVENVIRELIKEAQINISKKIFDRKILIKFNINNEEFFLNSDIDFEV